MYVWVMPEDINNLALFSLAVLDISTAAAVGLQPQEPAAPVTAKVKVLADQIKVLSDIYEKLPTTTQQQKKDKTELGLRIHLELAKLNGYYSNATPEQKIAQFNEFVKRTLPGFTGTQDAPDKEVVERLRARRRRSSRTL